MNTPKHASTTGTGANASTTGCCWYHRPLGYRQDIDEAHASTTGCLECRQDIDEAKASTTGYGAHASTTGYGANASALRGAAESLHGIAIGQWVKLTATSNNAVLIPEDQSLSPVVISRDDGWAIDTWITINGNSIVERPDVLVVNDGRGYMLRVFDGRYLAGCRDFNYDEAVAHWSNPGHPAPASAAILLAAVEAHHAAVTA
jgi:hypothetical protein